MRRNTPESDSVRQTKLRTSAPGAGADGGVAVAPGWQTLAVFALVGPALVVALGSPAVTLATVAGYVVGKSARGFPTERVWRKAASIRTLIAGVVLGTGTTEFEPVEERVE